MEMEKSKVSIHFVLFFRQSGDVLIFLCALRLRGYTATVMFTNYREFVQVYGDWLYVNYLKESVLSAPCLLLATPGG